MEKKKKEQGPRLGKKTKKWPPKDQNMSKKYQ
jgi:hypothetical protein